MTRTRDDSGVLGEIGPTIVVDISALLTVTREQRHARSTRKISKMAKSSKAASRFGIRLPAKPGQFPNTTS